VDRSSDKVGAKIRNARMERVPNMAILGQQEVEQGTVSVRIRGEEQPITKTVQQFIDDLLKEIASRSL
jgi:threonyl-tRNA synthetase